MSFVKKSYREIYEDMVAQTRNLLPELSDFQEGSVIRTLYESFAYEMATLYEQLDSVYKSGFVDSAEGANLDRVVAVVGVKRNEPDYATGVVTFSRDSGLDKEVTIPAGILVTTEDDPQTQPQRKAYFTVEEIHMAVEETEAQVRIKAEQVGRNIVTDAETIVVMPSPVPGIKAVTNLNPTQFLGREGETDAELRSRAKQTLLSSERASALAIKQALLSLPGIREVRIQELFEEENFGRIAVFVDGLDEHNSKLIRDKVNEVKAAGIFVRLLAAQPVYVDLPLKLSYADAVGDEEAQEQVNRRLQTQLTSYIDGLGVGQPLLFSQLVNQSLAIEGIEDAELDLIRARYFSQPDTPEADKETVGVADKRISIHMGERFRVGKLDFSIA